MLERHVYEDFNPAKFFWFNFASPQSKEVIYKDYYMRRDQFFKTCNDTLGGFDELAKTLCSNIDVLAKSGYSSVQIQRLKEVCAQGFCDAQNHFLFCGDFKTSSSKEEEGSVLMKAVVLLLVTLVVFVFLMFFTYNMIASIQEKNA
jgi:hypothetical protein